VLSLCFRCAFRCAFRFVSPLFLAHKTKLGLFDFPTVIVRPGPPDSKCQGPPVLGLLCLTLAGAGLAWPFNSAGECTSAAAFAVATRCDVLLGDGGRGPLLPKGGASGAQAAQLEAQMRAFLEAGWESADGGARGAAAAASLPTPHTLTLGPAASVEAENSQFGFASPRHLTLVFNQVKNRNSFLKHVLNQTWHCNRTFLEASLGRQHLVPLVTFSSTNHRTLK